MRVTVLTHLFPSEKEPLRGPFVAEQAAALATFAEVDVVCGERSAPDGLALHEGLRVRYLGLPWWKRLPKLSLLVGAGVYVRKAAEWLRSTPGVPDVIHAHYGFPDGVVGCLVGRALGVPCVVTLHGDDANLQLELPVVGKLIEGTLASASAIVCVSDAMRVRVAARHPRLAPLLITVPNGYDQRDIAFRPHRVPEYLLFLGALLPVKNPDLLIRAYARIAERTHLDLAIAGEGPMRSQLEELATRLGIRSRVRFMGRLEHRDVGETLAHAKALVLPSSHEGMPIVVLEALATGTPVVASAVGGIPELVTEPAFGELVEPGDVDALARALDSVAAACYDEVDIATRAPIRTWLENARLLARVYAMAIDRYRRRRGASGQRRAVYLTLQSTREGQAAHAHVHGIVRGLRSRGWQVDLYEPAYSDDAPGALARIAEWWRVQSRLRGQLRGADAVYVRTHFAALPTTLAAVRRRIPVVHELNGTWEDIFLAWPQTRRIGGILTALTRLQWRLSASLVTVTGPLATWASEQVPGVPVRVIPNGADTRIFRPGIASGGDLPPATYVVFVGALAPWQGIQTVLDATRDPRWPKGIVALIAGDGAERPAVERAVDEGLPVVSLGRVSYNRVPDLIRGGLAALSPQNSGHGRSDTGLSPLKVYEALACDTPVVVTDYPGQAELVRGASCGIVVPPEDPGALAEAVATLASDPVRARRMGERGGALVRRWHSWDARAADTEELLREVAAPAGMALRGMRLPRLEHED